MASIALGVVGGAIGSVFGQPFLGWSIGTVVGGLLFPPRLSSQVGAIEPFRVNLSQYGAPIPRIWGTMRITANIVWGLPLSPVQKRTGGKTSSTTVTTYYANFAAHLCQGPINRVKRIWANDLLIYDVSLTTPTKATIRIYTGTETQMPDSLIQSAMGVGQTPAFRGYAYAVFENFNLAPFGNSMPQLSFEIEQSTSATSGSIINDICQDCGIDPSDLDTSQGTDTMTGFVNLQRTQGKSLIDPILQVTAMDLAESDGMLTLVKRGGPSRVTIPTADLGASSKSRPETRLDVRRVQDVEIPSRIDLVYLSPSRQYQQMTQHALRQTKPSVRDALTINFYGCMDDTQARQAAERALYTAWREREQYRFVVGPKYLYLSVGDIVTLIIDGTAKRLRLDAMDTAIGGEIACTGILDETQVLGQPITGAAPPGNGSIVATTPVPTTFYPFAGPELQATDGYFAGFYVVAGPTGNAPNWHGGTIYYSSDGGTSWIAGGTITSASAIGTTASVLAAYGGANPDTTHTVNVALLTGTLGPATQAEVNSGINQALIGAEVLGFTTAALTSAFHYTLSQLTRAEIGTVTTGHASGEHFAIVGAGSVRVTVPNSLVGSTLQVKVVGPDDTIAGVTAQNVTILAPSGGPPGSGAVFPGGTTPQDVASTAAAGTATTFAPSDHRHRGVHKITLSADAYGDITFSGAGVTQTGNNFNFPAASGGSTSPLTTKGDLWGFSTVDARIPINTDGLVLTADSTQPLGLKWAAAPGAGNGPVWPVTQVVTGTTAYTALGTDTVLFCYTETVAQTITLPDASVYPGKIYVIFNAYQGTSQGLAIAATSPSTIVGLTNLNGPTVRRTAWYISDGTNWHSFDNSNGN